MLYLGTSPNDPDVAAVLDTRRLGLMCQPASNPPRVGWLWAADNGAFSTKWNAARWLYWLKKEMPRPGCLFAVVPDVVADHKATLARFAEWHQIVRDLRYPVAFVGQDGATADTIPWDDLDAFFVGGSTEWKLGPEAFALAAEARRRGKWVHVGRVNSLRRFMAWAPSADSCDGTFLAYGPRNNLPRLIKWLDHHDAHREPRAA